MPDKPKRPFSLLVSKLWIYFVSLLVPRLQRNDWRKEWNAEIWHQWQFLLDAGCWQANEPVRLMLRCLGALPDAFWHFASQEAFELRLRARMRSPWTCLGSLFAVLLVICLCTGAFPATRGLLFDGVSSTGNGLLFIWFHPSAGGDEGLPPDLAPAWRKHSRLLEGISPFVIAHRIVRTEAGAVRQPLIVTTEHELFDVLRVQPSLGRIGRDSGVVLTNALWRSLFHADPAVIGKRVQIGRVWRQVTAVLPASFHFLSRQPAAYLVERLVPDAQTMVVARVKPGVSEDQLDKDLTRIAETACYYNFRSELRYSYLKRAAWIPLEVFALAALAAALLVLATSRVSLRRLRALPKLTERGAFARRTAFFCAKVALAFLVIFTAAAEWSRSKSAILYASQDPAAGPFLLWLYILGSMGVLFWAVADQRARCRVCLQLLCFPVRVGCPGCFLLNWSGTELLCTEGHGMLHVPHMAPSWDEEAERWISLDASWKELFVESKPGV